jgi:hypothetical protein
MEAKMSARKSLLIGSMALGAALLLAASLTARAEDSATPAEGGAPAATQQSGAGAPASATDQTPAATPADQPPDAAAPAEPRKIVVEPADAPPADAAETPADAQPAEPPADAAETPAETAPAAAETPAEQPAPAAAEAPKDDIPVPTDPIAKAAFDVLSNHCAHCHQAGRLTGGLTKPKADFGNILRLDQIANDPHIIVPGNPDGSFLIKQIESGAMPDDAFINPPPDDVELAALRTWIKGLGEQLTAGCGRTFMPEADMVAAMVRDIEGLQKTRIADTRYITLTHLYNACARDDEMEVFRQGVVKLLNSLSRVSDIVRLETIDEAKTIIRFNITDLGWEAADWNRIIAVYPYPSRPDNPNYDFIAAATLTAVPYIRGDWFAFTAAQPPLYDVILKLPNTFQELVASFDLDLGRNIEKFVAKRAGFQDSGVSQHNRLIERHPIDTGYFWTSYDFGGDRDHQNLFEFPLGPGTGEFDFHHDGGETIFSLPNGFQGYYLNKATGERLDKGPTQIVRDKSRRDLAVTNGISCMGCHDQGIKLKHDEIRESVLATKTFPPDVRDTVEALYPTNEEMDTVLDGDLKSFQAAMVRAGLTPELKLDDKEQGVEMINALSKKYENNVDLRLAAAEFGQDQETFTQSLANAGTGPAVRLKQRLLQGNIPRETFETQFADFIEVVSDDRRVDLSDLAGDKIAVATVKRPGKTNFDLSLISDKASYKVDDQPVFTVTSEEDCFLTLINVDGKGAASVIFPNKFQKDNALRAKTDLNFPAKDSKFKFRFADPGTETVIAVCNTENKPVDDIKLDFGQVFTDLGDYEKHIAKVAKTRAIKVEAASGGAASSDASATAARAPTPARAAIKMKVE